MTEAQWIALAQHRVRRILRNRRFASIRQLEKKIAEAGPADMRPESVKISRALAALDRAGLVFAETHPGLATFYKPSDFGGAADERRRDHILALTRTFHRLTGDTALCGEPFERIVKTAASQSDRYRVISHAQQGLEIDSCVLERECDHLLFPRTFIGPTFVVEDKNLREWLTPSSEEVWALIGRALRVPHSVPVLVCRRMHYVAFGLFKKIGLVCWQVYSQYFAPTVELQLLPIRHKDGLGFSDVTTTTQPPPALARFFENTLPAHAETFRKRFDSNRTILERYAIDRGLERDTVGSARSAVFDEFRRQIQPPPEPTEPEDLPYHDL